MHKEMNNKFIRTARIYMNKINLDNKIYVANTLSSILYIKHFLKNE